MASSIKVFSDLIQIVTGAVILIGFTAFVWWRIKKIEAPEKGKESSQTQKHDR